MPEARGEEQSDELRRHSEDPAEGVEPEAAPDDEDALRDHPEGPAEG